MAGHHPSNEGGAHLAKEEEEGGNRTRLLSSLLGACCAVEEGGGYEVMDIKRGGMSRPQLLLAIIVCVQTCAVS